MSLDVYLHADAPPISPNGGSGIFVRRNGQVVEMSREEWDRAFPNQEPVILTAEYGVDTCVYSSNITHNLGKMADAAGIYKAMWRPEEIGATQAKQLIELLELGLKLLQSESEEFKKYNPSNGWGDYNGLVQFTSEYLDACKHYPEAKISISR